MSEQTTLIVIQGSPATGKTTLARKLSVDLEFGLLEKDRIKELLYDVLGNPEDRAESRIYGIATMNALLREIVPTILEVKNKLIIEGAFHVDLANEDIERIKSLSEIRLLQLFITARPDVMETRWRKRIEHGERHPGHLSQVDHVMNYQKYSELYAPLQADKTINVDTSNFNDDQYRLLLNDIKKVTGGLE